MRWLLALAVVTLLAGCASQGLSRADTDALIAADCVRTGGMWYGDNQFGGSCRHQSPSWP